MIRVETEAGPIDVEAEARHVSITNGGRLEVTREGTVIAQFRRWTHWHETTETEEQP